MRFGSREICDVTFKTSSNNQKVGKKTFKKAGQPVFIIDTATASTMSQETSVVYAQGGKGYNRLIAWEGEKTMTFTVTDALLSPMGLAVLTGAGITENAVEHFHTTLNVTTDTAGDAVITYEDVAMELGLDTEEVKEINVCVDIPIYASVLDNVGSVIDWLDGIEKKDGESSIVGTPEAERSYLFELKPAGELTPEQTITLKYGADNASKSLLLDFYVVLDNGVTKIRIAPESFGGNFYVEADTLYRNQNGKDMAAALTFPNVKIQSAFELAMSPTGDPSTFDFTMDAMPGYTMFDRKKKTVVDIQIIGNDSASSVEFHDDTDVEHDSKAAASVITVTDGDITANSDKKIEVAYKYVQGTDEDGKLLVDKLKVTIAKDGSAADPDEVVATLVDGNGTVTSTKAYTAGTYTVNVKYNDDATVKATASITIA